MPRPKKSISMDQIDQGLLDIHQTKHHLSINWTKEMDKDLLDARERLNPPIPYPRLKAFFQKKYGCGSEQSLRGRLRMLKEQQR